jgi:hypothetical protein
MTARLTCERHTSDMTHTQTGIEERASARRGSNGSSAPTPTFALVIPGDPRIARVARALEAAARLADGESLDRIVSTLGYSSVEAFQTMQRRETDRA